MKSGIFGVHLNLGRYWCRYCHNRVLVLLTLVLSTFWAPIAKSDVTIPGLANITGHGLPGMYLGTVRVTDVNGDGYPDVILAGHFDHAAGTEAGSGKIRIYKNVSSGPGDIKFQQIQEFSSVTGTLKNNASYVGLEVGDYDADGDQDFFAVFGDTQETVVGTNDGKGNFTLSTFNFIGRHIALGDLNNDGFLELLSTRLDSPVVHSWNGNQWVAKQSDFFNDICNGGIAVGDLNGDSFQDVLVGGNCGGFGNQKNTNPQTHSHWFRNISGSINPDAEACISTFGGGAYSDCKHGMDNGSYVLNDFDRDGHLDIAFAGSHEGFDGPPGSDWQQYDFFLLLNKDGTGKNFSDWQDAEGGAGNTDINGITSGDINGDGYPDIFFVGHQRVGDYRFQSRLYLNDGTGAMIRVHRELPHLGRGNGAFADFDGDGRVDLIYQGAELPYHSNSPTPTSDNNTASTIKTYIYRNIDGLPADGTKPTEPTGLQVDPLGNTLMLSWTAATDPESGIVRYNIYRNNIQVSTTSNTTYTDSGLQEGTTYSYQISAVNGAGLEGPLSAQVVAATAADTIPPKLDAVNAVGNTVVMVAFSEPVEQTSSEQAANYTFTSGVVVTTASLDLDLQTIKLATSPLIDGQDYTLTVNNVLDRAISPNQIAPDSQFSFTYKANAGVGDTNQPSYEWGKLTLGSMVYIDRDFTYISVPSAYSGLNYLRTANDDKNASGNQFLSFDLSEAGTVYVGYDIRNTTLPAWLQTWADTGDRLVTTDTTFKLYKKEFTAGTVYLGGNEFGNSMYVALTSTAASGIDTGGGNGNLTDNTIGSSTTGIDTGGGGGLGAEVVLLLLLIVILRHGREKRISNQSKPI